MQRRQSGIGAASVPALVETLSNDDAYLRDAAVEALGHIGPAAKEAVPILVERLADDREWARRNAAEALGCLGPAAESALPALLKAMEEDKNGYVRSAAAEALDRDDVTGCDTLPGMADRIG